MAASNSWTGATEQADQWSASASGFGGVTNYIPGLGGNDTLTGGDLADTLEGGKGDDLLSGGKGDDLFIFNEGDGKDTIKADDDAGNDKLQLNVGKDLVYAQKSGNDLIVRVGKAGDKVTLQDWFTNSKASINEIVDKDGKALFTQAELEAMGNAAPLNGQALKAGLDSDDMMVGGKKKDKLSGGKGDDTLLGRGNKDKLDGGWGNDLLDGGKGNDKLFGREGDDTLIGGAGKDKLTGGEGKDVFVFSAKLKKANADKITDFQVGEDKIQLKKSIVKKLKEGELSAENFRASKKGKALDKNDFIVYNTKTGVLQYDKNGKRAGGVVEIAKLTNKAKITAADIIIKK